MTDKDTTVTELLDIIEGSLEDLREAWVNAEKPANDRYFYGSQRGKEVALGEARAAVDFLRTSLDERLRGPDAVRVAGRYVLMAVISRINRERAGYSLDVSPQRRDGQIGERIGMLWVANQLADTIVVAGKSESKLRMFVFEQTC